MVTRIVIKHKGSQFASRQTGALSERTSRNITRNLRRAGNIITEKTVLYVERRRDLSRIPVTKYELSIHLPSRVASYTHIYTHTHIHIFFLSLASLFSIFPPFTHNTASRINFPRRDSALRSFFIRIPSAFPLDVKTLHDIVRNRSRERKKEEREGRGNSGRNIRRRDDYQNRIET